MISYLEALEILKGAAQNKRHSTESVTLSESIGRIIATDIVSSENSPSFLNSSMDGFAFCAHDTQGATREAPLTFRVNGMISAGDLEAFRKNSVPPNGGCIEIMTGAPIPETGYDAVEKIENVTVHKTSNGATHSVTLHKALQSGENIRPPGTDFKKGQIVVKEGTRIKPENLLSLAALGITEIKVRKPPRIAIISTGSELVAPETKSLEPGMIRNSTGVFLMAALAELGIQARTLGIVGDDRNLYRRTLETALNDGAEVILSTGAVSMGKYDFVSEILDEMKAQTIFHKVAIKPGKPLLFADLGEKFNHAHFFGIPGNPVSSAIALRFFIEPYIEEVLHPTPSTNVQAILTHSFSKTHDLRTFLKGRLIAKDGSLYAEILNHQGSHEVSSLNEANCWVMIPEEQREVKENQKVSVFALRSHGQAIF